jgi:copper homeostasis protein
MNGAAAGVRIEVCVGCISDALCADAGGAGRIEISSALEVDGVTPSAGFVEGVLERVRVPVVALVRARAGGFVYDAAEVGAMARDAATLAALGVEGVALGALRPDGRIDAESMRRMAGAARAAADGVRLVCHRAFDATPDLDAAAETLAALDFDRVLTSGGAACALDGAASIARLRALSGVAPIPAGGVRAANVGELVAATGCGWVHGSFRRDSPGEGGEVRLDERALRAALARAGQGAPGR